MEIKETIILNKEESKYPVHQSAITNSIYLYHPHYFTPPPCS